MIAYGRRRRRRADTPNRAAAHLEAACQAAWLSHVTPRSVRLEAADLAHIDPADAVGGHGRRGHREGRAAGRGDRGGDLWGSATELADGSLAVNGFEARRLLELGCPE